MTKIRKILIEQKKLLLVYMFLTKNKLPQLTNIHDLHSEYLKYIKKVASMKLAYGKYAFSSLIQDFGVRRKRTEAKSVWEQPTFYDPQDLIYLIELKTKEIENK